MFGSGALQVALPAPPWTLPLACGLGTLYPALLLAGSLAYADRDVPRWLAPAGFALGALRGALGLGGEPLLAHGAALVLEPALFLAAGGVLWSAARGGRAPARRAVAGALLAVGCLAGATALVLLRGGWLPPPLVTSWLVVGPALLALQLWACAQRTRSDLERARELLEQQVAEHSGRYQTVSELSSDYTFSLRLGPEQHLQTEWITAAFARITGHPPQAIEGLGWRDLVHPQDREAVVRQLAEVMARRRDSMHLRLVTADGAERWVDVDIARLDDAGDGSVRLVGAVRDVSERVRSARERRRMEEKLREMQRLESLGRLAGGIAHDFNNALTVVLGNARLAQAELPPDHPAAAQLLRICAAAEHAAGLTQQILAYSGRAAVDAVPLDVSAVVRDTLELLRASVGPDVSIETHLPAGLPLVEGDLTQLRQVLVNLVTNASEALGAQGGLVRIRTGARGLSESDLGECLGDADVAPGHYVSLEVCDSGPGLCRDLHLRIFEPFFSTKGEGRGLGLAAVHGIVRAHGGAIRVESDPGCGTRIELLLPRAARAAAPRPLARPAPGRGRGRVLVIDDDEAVLEVAGAFLTRAGFEVATAAGGREALQILGHGAPAVDAVVLDLVMPDLSGEDTFLALRERHPDLPVVLASGYDREQAAQRFSARGVADFVRKPFEPDALATSVRRALVERPPAAG
jgi:PAS domain S-box-containing protein